MHIRLRAITRIAGLLEARISQRHSLDSYRLIGAVHGRLDVHVEHHVGEDGQDKNCQSRERYVGRGHFWELITWASSLYDHIAVHERICANKIEHSKYTSTHTEKLAEK